MNEASKTNKIRGRDFSKKYLSGSVLDIGASNDPVCPHAEIFDVTHGDANHIIDYLGSRQFDTVHSSHCLEHMAEPNRVLNEWWRLVKPGGFMIIVVPEEDLYEQGQWPSIFNEDHKATFTLNRNTTWSPVSHDIYQMSERLPNSSIISAVLQAHGYKMKYLHKPGRLVRRCKTLELVTSNVDKIPWMGHSIRLFILKCFFGCGILIDQTRGSALAQIEVVIRKNED
jgi:SAM-dependent methyltransferase